MGIAIIDASGVTMMLENKNVNEEIEQLKQDNEQNYRIMTTMLEWFEANCEHHKLYDFLYDKSMEHPTQFNGDDYKAVIELFDVVTNSGY
ncbi:hypothetical protein [Paenibacillus sp. QZ-Y1]|uniref:hypothetical protein n=1 Tax=Paenibacillus sp. QZ-Y1 TaxID=3414511 RepID=UPI003F79B0A9